MTVNRDTVNYFSRFLFSDGTRVYKEIWEDEDCMVLLTDPHEVTLEHHISPRYPVSERTCLQIIGGLAERLYQIHSSEQVHGDLKPSNGSLSLATVV
jgi:serine/threonine protein kinase